MFKKMYRGLVSGIESVPAWLDKVKTTVAEDFSIQRKKALYSSVVWTDEQRREFDAYWQKNYGKKIPDKWHRLYQSVNGQYAIDYVPEKLYTTVIEPYFNDRKYATILQDKSLVETLAKDSGCVVPKTIVVSSGDRLFDENRKPLSLSDAAKILSEAKSVVIKPTVGSSSGKGIVFYETLAELDANDIVSVLKKFGKDYIVQQKIEQHSAFAAFNPSSVNTIRIITYIVDGTIHHAPLAFRIGRKDKSVDNIHAGGVAVGVTDSGLLLPEAYLLGYGDNNLRFYQHPDSGLAFAGYKLPSIPMIIQSAYAVHGKLPHIGIVSWDYTVDSNSNPVLIEANILGQGIWFPQMIHGKGAFGDDLPKILEMIK